MKCTKCNHEIPDEMLFCGYCGNPVYHSFGTKQFDLQMDEFLNELEAAFPERIISEASWNHARWDVQLKYICDELGYRKQEDFLTDCGFTLQFRLNESSPQIHSHSANQTRSSDRTGAQNKGSSIDIVHVIWVPLNIILLVVAINSYEVPGKETVAIISIVSLCFSVLGWLSYLVIPRCPKCKQKDWIEISRDFKRSEYFTKTKTVEDKVYGHSKNNRVPNAIPSNTIRRTVNVRAQRNYYNVKYKCRHCGYIRSGQISEVIELE